MHFASTNILDKMVYILSALYNLIHENSCNSLSSCNSFPHLQNQRYEQKMVWPMASFTLVPSSFSSTYICEWALNSQTELLLSVWSFSDDKGWCHLNKALLSSSLTLLSAVALCPAIVALSIKYSHVLGNVVRRNISFSLPQASI